MRLVHYSALGGDSTDGSSTAGDDSASDGVSSKPTEDAAGTGDVLATDVDLAESLLSQTRGLMFRRSLPEDYALAFRFDTAKVRDVHMLFVFVPIDALWIVDGVVRRVERLRPWRSFAREECDLLVELPAGAASDVDEGDRVLLEDG